jgi:hypothetical protein
MADFVYKHLYTPNQIFFSSKNHVFTIFLDFA